MFEAFIFLILGIAIGFVIGFLFFKNKGIDNENSAEFQQIKLDFAKQQSVGESLLKENDQLKNELKSERVKIEEFIGKNKSLETNVDNLKQQLTQQKEESLQFQEKFKTEFENIAHKILKQNTIEFSEENQKKMNDLLAPLKSKLDTFQQKVEENSQTTLLSQQALEMQIKNLKELNNQMSKDAVNLTKALKGDSKSQGNWGEMQLELILEKVGLEKDIHYRKEENLKKEDGQNVRPDFIINLPDNKHIIIDSKVSLTAYSNYFNEDDEQLKNNFLKEHVLSVLTHIKSLSEKNYQDLQVTQPDYILMFLANEPALHIVLKTDPDIFEKALERNIVLVSTSTLLATLRTISYIWKTDRQNKNANMIANRAAKLYEQFKRFTDDLLLIGKNINTAQVSYESAMKRLTEGKGNVLRQVEELKKMGANTTQQINSNLLERAYDEFDEEDEPTTDN
jgi:DNA recombination protein RmuC